jgi:hypothetical protein
MLWRWRWRVAHEKELEHAILKAAEKIFEGLEANAKAQNKVALMLQSIAQAIEDLVPPPSVADKLVLLYTLGGNTMGAPVSGSVGNTAAPTVVETAAGVPVAPIGPLAYASDNTAVVTVDPNSGVATLVAAGTANVSVIDQGNNLTDTVAFTVGSVAPPPADTLLLSYVLNPTKRR